MNFISRTLCITAIYLVMFTTGVTIFTWQYWAVGLLIIFYTVILAAED